MKPLPITSLGMICCVGHNVAGACAAQRAGIVRRTPLNDYWTYDASELEIRVTGAPVKGLTDGFVQTGTWVRLALSCLEDLVRYGQLPPADDAAFWRDTGLLWVLPELSFERFGWPEEEIPKLLKQFCGQLLENLSRLPFQQPPSCYFPAGNVGGALAAEQARQLLESGSLRRVIILAADSWLDRLSMNVLVGERRLKTGERAAGLCPGEAAACVLVESPTPAQARHAMAQSVLLGAAARPAPARLAPEDTTASRVQLAPAAATQLANAVAQVLDSAGLSQPFRGDILLDLNGENWKALVWGHAQTLLSNHVDLSRSKKIFPAISFGDIGAASGVAAVCVATRAFVRRYASTDHTLICSIADDCGTSAMLVGCP